MRLIFFIMQQYLGRVGMMMSMRSLAFEDRTTVTREAINMACEKSTCISVIVVDIVVVIS